MKDKNEADTARKELHNHTFNGSSISVQFSTSNIKKGKKKQNRKNAVINNAKNNNAAGNANKTNNNDKKSNNENKTNNSNGSATSNGNAKKNKDNNKNNSALNKGRVSNNNNQRPPNGIHRSFNNRQMNNRMQPMMNNGYNRHQGGDYQNGGSGYYPKSAQMRHVQQHPPMQSMPMRNRDARYYNRSAPPVDYPIPSSYYGRSNGPPPPVAQSYNPPPPPPSQQYHHQPPPPPQQVPPPMMNSSYYQQPQAPPQIQPYNNRLMGHAYSAPAAPVMQAQVPVPSQYGSMSGGSQPQQHQANYQHQAGYNSMNTGNKYKQFLRTVVDVELIVLCLIDIHLHSAVVSMVRPPVVVVVLSVLQPIGTTILTIEVFARICAHKCYTRPYGLRKIE